MSKETPKGQKVDRRLFTQIAAALLTRGGQPDEIVAGISAAMDDPKNLAGQALSKFRESLGMLRDNIDDESEIPMYLDGEEFDWNNLSKEEIKAVLANRVVDSAKVLLPYHNAQDSTSFMYHLDPTCLETFLRPKSAIEFIEAQQKKRNQEVVNLFERMEKNKQKALDSETTDLLEGFANHPDVIFALTQKPRNDALVRSVAKNCGVASEKKSFF